MKQNFIFLLLAAFMLSASFTNAETYNFYFDSNKKSKTPDKTVEVPEEETTPPTPAPAAPQVVTPPPAPEATAPSTQTTTFVPEPKSPFLFHLGAIFMPEEWSVGYGDVKKETIGALLGIDLELGARWTLGAHLGVRRARALNQDYPFFGVESEFKMIQVGFNSTYRTLEFGPIFGTSTLNAPQGLALYTGVRGHITFSDSFGFIGTARVNLGYSQFELGLVARL